MHLAFHRYLLWPFECILNAQCWHSRWKCRESGRAWPQINSPREQLLREGGKSMKFAWNQLKLALALQHCRVWVDTEAAFPVSTRTFILQRRCEEAVAVVPTGRHLPKHRVPPRQGLLLTPHSSAPQRSLRMVQPSPSPWALALPLLNNLLQLLFPAGVGRALFLLRGPSPRVCVGPFWLG